MFKAIVNWLWVEGVSIWQLSNVLFVQRENKNMSNSVLSLMDHWWKVRKTGSVKHCWNNQDYTYFLVGTVLSHEKMRQPSSGPQKQMGRIVLSEDWKSSSLGVCSVWELGLCDYYCQHFSLTAKFILKQKISLKTFYRWELSPRVHEFFSRCKCTISFHFQGWPFSLVLHLSIMGW